MEKEKLTVRIKNAFINSKNEIHSFLKEHLKKILPWFFIITAMSAISLFFTPWTTSDNTDFPQVICNLLPRAISLLLLTIPAFIVKRRYTYFVAGSTLWVVWMLILSTMKLWGIIIFAILGIAATIVIFFYEKKKDTPYIISEFMTSAVKWFYAYALLELAIELIHRLNLNSFMFNLQAPFKSFLTNPDYFANNMLVIIGCSLFVFVVPKRKLAFSITASFWIILSFVSYLKYNNVYEPALLLDMFEIPEAIAACKKYLSVGTFILAAVGLVAIIALVVFLAKKEKKTPFRLTNLILVIFTFVIIVVSFFGIRNLHYTNLENKYVRSTYFTNGFVYSFFNYALNSIVVEPDGYSIDALDEIKETVNKQYKPRTDSVETQNIIVVQLESFCDPYLFRHAYPDMKIERDPMPYMRSLMRDYTSGTIDVPVFGGQTVKSEYELLTGLNMDMLPNGYNPYVQYLNSNTIDSFVRRMDELGYDTTAIHTYQGEFFDRNIVYQNLGFDRFIPYEFMSGIEKRTGSIWANDEILLSEINNVLNSTEGKDFVFTVTVQLHGNYNPYDGEYENPIDHFEDEDLASRLTYYLSELEAFDKTIENLVKQLEERNEPTYVLFYSDHLPSLFYGVDEMSDDEKFTTQFFTWNNLGLEKQSDKDLELYELTTFLCDTLNIDGGYINKFHNVYSKKENYLESYSKLQHYMMFEDCNKPEYENESYTIGLYPLTIDSISIDSLGDTEQDSNKQDGNINYIIKGSRLTENTVLAVNGKIYDLVFKDANTAILEGYTKTLTSSDIITLRVIGEKYGEVFFETEPYIYK